ncbi:PHD finger 3 [Micractinium conductrix]|uniref:PHD finger 3 n=1 Tax=Micractinium conductrix TaxID=554055 RepID=A0A2P6V7J3_9CHLO|nr:PHD finger 3 [Micractinium conductrix]|eukprot:PSC70050.1 PHD finger 3 [Micractinium conductrix]
MRSEEGANAMEEEDLDALWGNDAPRAQAAPQPPADTSTSDEDSYFEGSDSESADSVTRRARKAAARIVDFEEAASKPAAGGGVLPSASAAFTEVDGPPAFLDPEATRPLAAAVHRAVVNVGADGGALPDPGSANQHKNKRGQAAGDWDVSQMAPKLKEQQQQEKGVITGAAVRYRTDDRVGTVSGAQIAMLGGHVKDDDTEGAEEGGGMVGPGAPGPGKHPAPKGKPTKPMGVDEFLEKGVGGAQLPRKRQDRKDKEKDKRLRGQSTHASWKSEAEMALRQQYDS